MSRRSQRSIQRKMITSQIAEPTEDELATLDDLGLTAKDALRAAINHYLDKVAPAPKPEFASDVSWDKTNRMMVLK